MKSNKRHTNVEARAHITAAKPRPKRFKLMPHYLTKNFKSKVRDQKLKGK